MVIPHVYELVGEINREIFAVECDKCQNRHKYRMLHGKRPLSIMRRGGRMGNKARLFRKSNRLAKI